jgi:hypothetical protein
MAKTGGGTGRGPEHRRGTIPLTSGLQTWMYTRITCGVLSRQLGPVLSDSDLNDLE